MIVARVRNEICRTSPSCSTGRGLLALLHVELRMSCAHFRVIWHDQTDIALIASVLADIANLTPGRILDIARCSATWSLDANIKTMCARDMMWWKVAGLLAVKTIGHL